MKAFWWVVVTVAIPLLLAEVTECGRWLAQRLIRWSARRLRDPEAAARYEEEWLANLAAVPGNLIPLFHALGVLVHVRQLRDTLTAKKQRRTSGVGFSARLTDALITGLYASLPVTLTMGLVWGLVSGLINGLVGGLVVGLVVGLVYGLAVLFGARLSTRMIVGLSIGLNAGLFTVLLVTSNLLGIGLGYGLAVMFGARPTVRVIVGLGAGVAVGVVTGDLAWPVFALDVTLAAELGGWLSFRLLERRARLNQRPERDRRAP